ncbi:hypothetical protein Vadar_018378 [Vaccinium darrowii]|uniref:Uncharacterized protein n=1 Tax=Vaccinium darrowii TaxID=229202 RepID=A0ACB7ZCM9_9ERIC|nr:hypothetical protein Vadar_018378 [Vaccinium darrowii]
MRSITGGAGVVCRQLFAVSKLQNLINPSSTISSGFFHLSRVLIYMPEWVTAQWTALGNGKVEDEVSDDEVCGLLRQPDLFKARGSFTSILSHKFVKEYSASYPESSSLKAVRALERDREVSDGYLSTAPTCVPKPRRQRLSPNQKASVRSIAFAYLLGLRYQPCGTDIASCIQINGRLSIFWQLHISISSQAKPAGVLFMEISLEICKQSEFLVICSILISNKLADIYISGFWALIVFAFLSRFDLYLPKNSEGPDPVLAFVTGGAWIIGYKAWVVF